MDLSELKRKFIRFYGDGEIRTFYSPGRINLIGDQIGYNGGLALSCALELGTFACVRKRKDKIVNLISTNFDLKVSLNLDDIIYHKEEDWANYPKGIMKIMQEEGYRVGGMDILVNGYIPIGVGLSPDASLEILIAVIINDLFNEGRVDRAELAKVSQKAENKFIGVNCGIIDKFVVGMGRKNKAIFLNCGTLEYSYGDAKLGRYVLVIMNINRKIGLDEYKYYERTKEYNEVMKEIRSKKNTNFLCELSVEEFSNLENYITNNYVRKIARHMAYENERVKEAYECLIKGEIHKFGSLLVESHRSLRDLYEVAGKELDIIVEASLKAKGCIGARMIWDGFGCCAVALVNKVFVKGFTKKVRDEYIKRVEHEVSFYISNIGEGTKELF